MTEIERSILLVLDAAHPRPVWASEFNYRMTKKACNLNDIFDALTEMNMRGLVRAVRHNSLGRVWYLTGKGWALLCAAEPRGIRPPERR